MNSSINTNELIMAIDSNELLVSTTPTIDGYHVAKTLDIVTAECVFGLNFFKDLFAGLTDFFGGRSNTTQSALRDARMACLNELRKEAAMLGANAVVGVSLDYSEFSGQGKSMLFLVAAGTAVILEPKKLLSLRMQRPDNLVLENSQYRLYLAEKYQVRRHELLGEYIVVNQMFPTVDQALQVAHKEELTEIEQEILRSEEAKRLQEELLAKNPKLGDVSETDAAMMAEYNIRHDGVFFICQTYRYEKLADAINFAKSKR